MIGRAIESCLSQDCSDFEIIVIDDGSTDNTVEQVEAYQDNRIILLKHKTNRGVCPARNTGIMHARGQWLLMLDSDFELLTGALRGLAQRTATVGADIGNVASSCQWDTGIITPWPSVPEKPIGYEEYLAWMDILQIPEWFNCLRHEVFATVLYPEGRAYEDSFHLSVIRRWKIDISREPAIIFHTDAKNRITAAPPEQLIRRLLQDAVDCAIDSEAILREHGSAMQEWAPRGYSERLNITAMHFYLASQRQRGIKYSVQALKRSPLKATYWATLFLGICGAKSLAWVKTHR
jgi:hypothetical protein